MMGILNKELSYQEQLEQPEWVARKESILKRDNYTCRFCGKGKSILISFDNIFFNVGIDHSKKMIDCSKANLSNPIKLKNFAATWNSKNAKGGLVPDTEMIGIILSEGIFLYSVWNKSDDFTELIKSNDSFVANVACEDGYIAYIIYQDKLDLIDLQLPRIYVQSSSFSLQVHHKHYIFGQKAWEYDEEELVTLCNECHSKVHKFLPVQIFAKVDDKLKAMNFTPCHRCNGTGYFPEYRHVEDGVCFRCHGNRFEELIPNNNLI